MLLLGLGFPVSTAAETRIRFSDFYIGQSYQAGVGMRPALQISPKLVSLQGQNVEILGFMDGLLPRDGMFFMILREPLIGCPFHAVDFDWASFAAVFLKKGTSYIDGSIRVRGRLDVGRKNDETGLMSYVRIYDAEVSRYRP
jgi:hypothetical protein